MGIQNTNTKIKTELTEMTYCLNLFNSIFSKDSAVLEAKVFELAPKYLVINTIKNTNNNKYPANFAAEK